MAIRCTHCDSPVTHSEAEAGKCPVCGTVLDLPADGPVAVRREPKKLGFFALFLILFFFGVFGALIHAALFNFRTGNGTTGAGFGMAFGYGILHSLGLVGKKE